MSPQLVGKGQQHNCQAQSTAQPDANQLFQNISLTYAIACMRFQRNFLKAIRIVQFILPNSKAGDLYVGFLLMYVCTLTIICIVIMSQSNPPHVLHSVNYVFHNTHIHCRESM